MNQSEKLRPSGKKNILEKFYKNIKREETSLEFIQPKVLISMILISVAQDPLTSWSIKYFTQMKL